MNLIFIYNLLSTLLITAIFQSGWPAIQHLERMSSRVTTLFWKDGVTLHSTSRMYYQQNGILVMHHKKPEEMIIRTNRWGEVYVYRPADHSVSYEQNRDLSSTSTQYYLFFHGLTDDMGLRSMGFEPKNNRFEDEFEISEWWPPQAWRESLGRAELVHKDYRPVYLALHDRDDQIVQKTYFHQYTEILNRDFPLRLTTIQYSSEGDSVVIQTRFEDVEVNPENHDYFFDFQIPEDARIHP